MMKAMVYEAYGSPDVLRLENVELPVPQPNEVLIKVAAASVNSWDWDLLRGEPFIVRLPGGIKKPEFRILGADAAGVVQSTGNNVKQFRQGDAVFGDLCSSGWGGFAEYVCADEKALILKPSGLTFEDAAALPQAGVMAMQGLYDIGKLQAGMKVLINGAGGGVGTYAVQLAKLAGAEVTGVDNGDKFALLRSLGVDHVIDYTREDFTINGKQYDLILDVVAHRSIFDYKRALSPTGIYVVIGGVMSRIFQFMLLGPLISITSSRKMRILNHSPNKNLSLLAELVSSGKIKSVIHKCYSLAEVPKAMQCLGEGKVKGKAVIKLVP